MKQSATTSQRGMFLIEALIAILIFALGILGMIAMGGKAVSAQSDAQYRTEASNLADAIAGQIALNVDRSGDTTIAGSLNSYTYNENGADCAFSGTNLLSVSAPSSGVSSVIRLLAQAGASGVAGGGLPGVKDGMQQILIDTAAANRVAITLCWEGPNDTARRRHTLVTYVN